MLYLRIDASALQQPWRAAGDELRCAGSWLRALRHPMLESWTLSSPEAWALVVRERGCAPQPDRRCDRAAFERALHEALAWPLQTMVACVDRRSGTLTIRQGRWGVAPLYLARCGGTLHGHWDPLALYPLLDHVHLGRAARFLHAFDMPYGRHTLFSRLSMTTAGSQAQWRAGQEVCIAYPAPAAPPRARLLRRGAAPVEQALGILDAALRRWLHADVRYASELSGGLDSSLVAIVASSYRPTLPTFGIDLDAPGQQQRRAALIARFAFADTTVDLARHLPLGAGSARWKRGMVPWEEIYDEGVNAMLARAAGMGVQAMFTGFGGDELCPLHAGEPPPDLEALEPAAHAHVEADFVTPRARGLIRASPAGAAPRALVDHSSLESAAFGTALYLRHGIWPIHPLCTPELNAFCASLPWEWRVGRTIERAMLRQVGCPTDVSDNRTVDSFQMALSAGLRDGAAGPLAALLADPLLAELGLVDSGKLNDGLRRWLDVGSDDDALPFYGAASLELSLRQVGTEAAT